MNYKFNIQTLQPVEGAPQVGEVFMALHQPFLKNRIQNATLLMSGGIDDGLSRLTGKLVIKVAGESNVRSIYVKWDQRRHEDGRMWSCFSLGKRKASTGENEPEYTTPSGPDATVWILRKFNIPEADIPGPDFK